MSPRCVHAWHATAMHAVPHRTCEPCLRQQGRRLCLLCLLLLQRLLLLAGGHLAVPLAALPTGTLWRPAGVRGPRTAGGAQVPGSDEAPGSGQIAWSHPTACESAPTVGSFAIMSSHTHTPLCCLPSCRQHVRNCYHLQLHMACSLSKTYCRELCEQAWALGGPD